MNLTAFARRRRRLALLERRVRNLRWGKGWGGFHADTVYRELMLSLLREVPCTSFVETGTYFGFSTELVALHFPLLPVHTCEISQQFFDFAGDVLKKFPNVHQHLGSSEKLVQKLIDEKQVGDRPLFYLDAHWDKYWPLRDELTVIGRAGLKAVIVIDDFQVIGQKQFGYDVDGGAAKKTDRAACNLDYIRSSLLPPNQFQVLYPRYQMADAKITRAIYLRGHIVLFQNLPAEFDAFTKLPLIQQHYFQHTI